MKICKFKETRKFQMGGAVPEQVAQPAMGTEARQAMQDEQEAMAQIGELAQNIISQMGPDAAAMLAQAIMEMLQGAQPVGGGEQGEPVFKKGGKICKRIKKVCKGSKA